MPDGKIMHLYRRFVQPRQQKAVAPEREHVFVLLLFGTFALTLALFLLLVISYLSHNAFIVSRLVLCAVSFMALIGIYGMWRISRYTIAAILLVLYYGLLAGLVVAAWGINTPFGILLLGVTIVFAGILLKPRHSLYATAAAIIFLLTLQLSINAQLYEPQISKALTPSNFGDVLGYSVIFSILALVSWLFGKSMEQSLKKAQEAELALLDEKELLEVRVAERTLELEALQFEEMQQLYRFAEMGQLSAALLHDLANQLTILTLDIEDLRQKEPRSQALSRARNSVRHLEQMIEKVRNQLQGDNQSRRFNAISRLKDTLQLLQQKTRTKNIELELLTGKHKTVNLVGDPTRFSQAIAILITNSIDAYEHASNPLYRSVKVKINHNDTATVISVADWGAGIPKTEREKLFQPFYSTKKTGMGIGLFIARQIIEKHFGGTLSLATTTAHTEFIITIPHREQ